MVDKLLVSKKVKEIVDKFSEASRNKDYINGQSEENIKTHYIEPLLEALGWTRWDMQKEERVLRGRADYILKIGNEEVLVVEAKKTGVSLTEEEGRQAVSYAYHRKIKFAVLTNFKEIRVYHALSNIKNIDKNILKKDGAYFRLGFSEFLEKFDLLWLLSKESFENQEINKLLSKKDERMAKPVDQSILDDLLHIRDVLSKDIKKLRPYLKDEQIDEAVQLLIDRLIFMRSVEDRGMENANFLLGIVKDYREGRLREQLWYALLKEFKRFDKEYDSKLFSQGILEDEKNVVFDNDVLQKTIRALYFGVKDEQARYMFDEIPGDLLGNIYEQYLGTILSGTDKRVKLEAGTGKRKKMGIYYTPSYIVDYIVKNTVREYIKDKTIDEILEVKILDPACGSGSFLIHAFQEVCDVVEEKLKKEEFSKTLQSFGYYLGRISLAQKATILSNCIYGVDLDEKAVELAQLNLLLKMLEHEGRDIPNKRLPNLLGNIKNGNSLIDDPKVSDRAFNWHAQFPEVFKNGGFDVVVGNPPYFKIREDDPVKKIIYYEEIKSGMMNISAVFINRALSLLKEKGRIGMIVPKMLAFTDSWEKIRNKLLLKTSVTNVVDAGKAFEDVLLEQIIFCLAKTESPKNRIKIGEIKNNKTIEETSSIEQSLCLEDNKIYLESEALAYSIKSKMDGSGLRLGDVSNIFLGLGIQGLDNFVNKPKIGYKKALGGNEIQRWTIRGYWYYNENDKELLKYKNQM
ncbi:MAG: N-6 DNA methylase, partial [Nanoarchaeota archaeon]|nr:N-6 DNA methylase [Nanoarchaeota archaeon]